MSGDTELRLACAETEAVQLKKDLLDVRMCLLHATLLLGGRFVVTGETVRHIGPDDFVDLTMQPIEDPDSEDILDVVVTVNGKPAGNGYQS